MSVLFDHVSDMEGDAVHALAAAEVRRLPAGSSHRAESFRDVPFLIVEEGFVVVRRATRDWRDIVVHHAGAGALLAAPDAGETLDALAESRVTLVAEAVYRCLLAHPAVAAVLSDALRATLRQE